MTSEDWQRITAIILIGVGSIILGFLALVLIGAIVKAAGGLY